MACRAKRRTTGSVAGRLSGRVAGGFFVVGVMVLSLGRRLGETLLTGILGDGPVRQIGNGRSVELSNLFEPSLPLDRPSHLQGHRLGLPFSGIRLVTLRHG